MGEWLTMANCLAMVTLKVFSHHLFIVPSAVIVVQMIDQLLCNRDLPKFMNLVLHPHVIL